MTERTEINPRYFGDRFGYAAGIVVESPRRWMVVAGHEARNRDGEIAERGDLPAQIRLTFANLASTLAAAGFDLSHVVQIRIFTVDIDAMKQHYDVLTGVLAEAGCRPTSLLAQVVALSDPAMLLEVEALAVQ